MDKVFKALADATRRKLLDRLHEKNGQTLGELCEHLAMTRQGATKHLVILEEANLIATKWQGREKLHYLNPVPIHEIFERWTSKYEKHRLDALAGLKKDLEEQSPILRRSRRT
jgi:DNA-binding transcriptional ArsR family regulator